jgi:ubiquitin conjugation factor E4 B
MVRNPHLRAMIGDVLYELFLPSEKGDRRDVPPSVYTDSMAGGQTYLLSSKAAQETLAPSLLLLYGEVERTGYYEKMSHRAKISSLIQYLWESAEHRPAFRRITQNKESFIQFANGIINETNTLIATVMQKLPEIRAAQVKMKNAQEWGQLTEEQQKQIEQRLEEGEREVKYALPLCNKTLQMFGYLNTDEDIRKLFLLEELCPRLVTMLLHVLTKLVGSKGLELKVDNPEELEFKPKIMLQDLCKIFSLFASDETFQMNLAQSGCDSKLLQSALKPVRRLGLLKDEQLAAFESLPDLVDAAAQRVAEDETLFNDPPDEFLDEILSTFMKDPVILPSGHVVDRHTISQHLLNNPQDPFNREPLSIDDIKPATELKAKMELWKEEKRAAAAAKTKSAME